MNDERAETLSELPGEHLAHVVFGGDLWLSLSFDSGAQLTLFRWPVVYQGDGLLSHGDPGYSDAIIALVGLVVVSAHQTSDYRLALEFEESKRLAVPLGGSLDDVASYDVAVLRGVRSDFIGVWTAGELPPSPHD